MVDEGCVRKSDECVKDKGDGRAGFIDGIEEFIRAAEKTNDDDAEKEEAKNA